MISSLFRRASVNEVAKENKKDDAQEALKPRVQIDASMPVDDLQQSSYRASFDSPRNLDQLAIAARELLMDKNLEVSKVRPFFWSMVEAYLDRFNIYPFDVVKALFSYIESEDYTAEELRQLVKKLEEYYDQQYGEPMHKSTCLVSSGDSLDDEIKELRESIKYASLVGELEEEV